MERRKFLSTLIGGVAATAAVRTFPFRVFSFPKEIQSGTWGNLERCPYPARLSTPYLSNGVAVTPELIRRAIEQMKRMMGTYPYDCIS